MVNAAGLGLDNASSLVKVEVVQVWTLLNGSVAIVAMNKQVAIAGMWQLPDKAHRAVRELIWTGGGSDGWLLKKHNFQHFFYSIHVSTYVASSILWVVAMFFLFIPVLAGPTEKLYWVAIDANVKGIAELRRQKSNFISVENILQSPLHIV